MKNIKAFEEYKYFKSRKYTQGTEVDSINNHVIDKDRISFLLALNKKDLDV